MGLYRSSNVYCTQCEAEGFRRITYFLDRPDILSVYTVRIEALRNEAPLLLSNGNPASSGDLAGGRHYAVWHDPFPKPSYLFALVAGDLGPVADSFVTTSGRKVELGIYVEHGKERARRLRHGRAEALDAMGRGGVRPRIRPRCLQHRRRVRLQHGRDGKQGPQHLQRQICAGRPGDRDGRRFRQYRGDHRA